MILNFQLDITEIQLNHSCQTSRSKVISLKSYCSEIHTHTGPCALQRPLK